MSLSKLIKQHPEVKEAPGGGSSRGYVQGLSVPTVLQMVQMEHATCTLHVKNGSKTGRLHFRNGQLVDADVGWLKGEAAAYEMVNWQSPDVEIAPFVEETPHRIQCSLTAILLNSRRIADEAQKKAAERKGPVVVELPRVAASEQSMQDLDTTEVEVSPPAEQAEAAAEPAEPEAAQETTPNESNGAAATADDGATMEREKEMNSLHEVLESFRDEVPEFVSTDIVNIESGLSIGGGSIDSEFDASIASASYAEVVKSNRRALDLLGLGAESTEDLLISTNKIYILIRMLGGEYYHLLAVGRRGNLGLARAIMKKYESKLLSAIGDLA